MKPTCIRPRERFVGAAVRPAPGSFDPATMAVGEPGLPSAVHWNGQTYQLVDTLERWKTTSACSHGSSEQYVRRHWYRVRTDRNIEMTLYCDRQASRGRKASPRWWLYTTAPATTP